VVPLINHERDYIALSDSHIVGFTGFQDFFHDSMPSLGASSIESVNDTILALGYQLRLYRCFTQNNRRYIEQVKQYPNISGTSMLADSNTLIVVNKQGLSFYDISNLENITLIK
jgi:hypothetical protein